MRSAHWLSCGKRCEVLDAYLLLARSKEKLVMLEEDAQHSLDYYKERQEAINAERFEVNAGKKSMLHYLLREILSLGKD